MTKALDALELKAMEFLLASSEDSEAETIITELLAELRVSRRLREAAQTFCNRVDAGHVRSTRTYNTFKEILRG